MGQRIYYPVHQVGIKTSTDSNYTELHGLQSVTTNSVFNSTPVAKLGNMSPHDVITDSSEVAVTLKKLLDGYPLIFTLATSDAVEPTIFQRAIQKCDIGLSVFDDSLTHSVGTPVSVCNCKDMFMSSFSYVFDSQSNFEESVSFVGNEKIWSNDTRIVNSEDSSEAAGLSFDGVFDSNDSPYSYINRRQHFLINGVDGDTTILPTDIVGVNNEGQPSNTHVSRVSISANINRESVGSLGKSVPHYRIPTFPIEVTTEITTNSVVGDGVSHTENGILGEGESCSYGGNLEQHVINIAIDDGTRIGVGYQNKLASVNYQGGDAGQSNYVTTSYTYKTYDVNPCCILHQTDSKHPDFWADRVIWLLPIAYTPTLPANGISAFYWNNNGHQTGTLTLSTWPPDESEIYKFNVQVDRTNESITGLLIEEQIDQLNNTGIYTTWQSVGSGQICGAGCSKMLFNIYDNVVNSGAISGTSIYQYRIKGLYSGTESNPTFPITLNISYE